MANPTTNKRPDADAQTNNKRRRKKSIVWEHFIIQNIDSECSRAFCKQCKKSFAYISGSKLAGTSHLKRHIELGICPASRLKQENGHVSPCAPVSDKPGTQGVNVLPKKRFRAKSGSASVPFYQDHCRSQLVKMIIMHEYPLDIVEHPGFLDSVRSLQPHFNIVTLDTIQSDCEAVYRREKQALLNLIGSIPGRVNLALDLWITDQSIGYAFITGQFIDSDWRLHRQILSVVLLPFPDSESAFNHAVVSCIDDWNLENKLFTLALDESFANEAVRENLRGLLSIKNPLLLKGQLLIGNCYARVLSHLAQDALGSMRDTVKKVRDSVKYVVMVEAHQEKFNDLKQQLQVPSAKSLILDDQTQWNTTYHMLQTAFELKEVFSCMDAFDPDYKETPSMDEWKQVDVLCKFLRLLFDAANILTGPTYPSADAFYHEVWKIQYELKRAAMGEDVLISSLTRPMYERFDKYWKDCSLVFAIAVVMDPRFKMKLVEFTLTKIYGEDADSSISVVNEGVHELFLDYIVQMLPPPTFVVHGNGGFLKTDITQEQILHIEIPGTGMPEGEAVLHPDVPKTQAPQDEAFSHSDIKMEMLDYDSSLHFDIPKTEMPQDDILLSTSDGLSDFDVYISEIMSHQHMKSELDQYLEESVLPRTQEFDVLGWWKLNRQKYPTLSKMASDILCIPGSTVSQESVFDVTSKKMDRHRCSLRPSTLEALICAKDWLRFDSAESSLSVSSNGVLVSCTGL